MDQSSTKWDCGITEVINTISGKWKINILWILFNNEKIGFNQLKRKLTGISNKMLINSLNNLIEKKYISKNKYGTKAPFVSEYQLTSKGLSLIPLLQELNQWENNN
ncbi:winged helix-turn-helix transcriptional regulator [Fructilactobacillus sp. Tb1]|uniref:winged helix-turn-helix transcriptional regulator n=1 Tax=Fructilactobacillus sp. Tb1 TaxID=3422304 RepID=UPI003D2AB7AE